MNDERLAATRALEARLLALVVHESGQHGVVARVDLAPGTLVTRFLGRDCAWSEVPASEVVYVNSFAPSRWTIPVTLARYINHSCDPNCEMRTDRDVVTVRAVAAGEALTHDYEWADAEAVRRHPEHYFWDPRWTFTCLCGSAACRGVIDRYRPR